MKKIIWQPELVSRCGHEFGALLDRTFAEEMIKTLIPKETQRNLNKTATEDLKNLGIKWYNPYLFYETSCLVKQINLGNNGVWLATNHREITRLLSNEQSQEPIQYNSHNVDNSKHAHALMFLFNKWVDYSETLKEYALPT